MKEAVAIFHNYGMCSAVKMLKAESLLCIIISGSAVSIFLIPLRVRGQDPLQ